MSTRQTLCARRTILAGLAALPLAGLAATPATAATPGTEGRGVEVMTAHLLAASPLLWVPLLVAAEHILTRTERDLP